MPCQAARQPHTWVCLNGKSRLKDLWIAAAGLMLIFEGVIPLFFPKQWRETFRRLVQLEEGQIRFFGLIALLLGLIIVSFVVSFSD